MLGGGSVGATWAKLRAESLTSSMITGTSAGLRLTLWRRFWRMCMLTPCDHVSSLTQVNLENTQSNVSESRLSVRSGTQLLDRVRTHSTFTRSEKESTSVRCSYRTNILGNAHNRSVGQAEAHRRTVEYSSSRDANE